MKRNVVVFSIIVLFAIAFSCEKGSSTLEVNCADCLSNEPDSFELSVDLTINSVYDSVYLQFYKGNVESGKLSWEGEVFTPRFYHLVPVDEYYSVKASYRNNGKKIIAIDGDKMISRYMSDACDGPCWIVKGGIMNVKLKFQ
jgi:hypothetical protein